ncbi:hypothetical protein M0R88_01070 [Halorussus gelatinilyticus]|uniref:Uncharacterized protein n=1 Tax=Halorussus gelatinilyticus TaxID=2937524 RepID=A0A8U0IIT3_9EURY|nr:hypothetical protein [Halorussus gelatinilyticus]UPW00708.1 hypothetical protein M0R88_01070 [Halorussus gelatinilyticus]
MNTTALALAATAALVASGVYFSGFEYGNLLYFVLMGVGLLSLGYVYFGENDASSV